MKNLSDNFLEKLIKTRYLICNMLRDRNKNLEKKISLLLDKATNFIPVKGRDIYLYIGNISYKKHLKGIEKFWTGKHPTREYPVGIHRNVTKRNFLDWINSQPHEIKLTVYNNLLDYINTETPKERGEIEFRSYLFE